MAPNLPTNKSSTLRFFVVSLITAITLVLLVLPGVGANNRVACPTDPSVWGYTSIELLNADIVIELNAMQQQQQQQQENTNQQPRPDLYEFTLCPHTTFVVPAQAPLLVALNHTNFICGSQGLVEDGCMISGGDTQVWITDTPLSTISYTAFHGLTFASSRFVSIAAFANAGATAEFYNCHWLNNSGGASILMQEQQASSTAATTTNTLDYGSNTNNQVRHLAEQVLQSGLTHHHTINSNRRQMQGQSKAMTVRLIQSKLMNGLSNTTVYPKGYSAVYSAGGFLQLNEVEVLHNQGNILFNFVFGATAVIVNSTLAYNQATAALIRPIATSLVQLESCRLLQNQAESILAVIGNSQANVQGCLWENNVASPGSEVMILMASRLELFDTCFLQDDNKQQQSSSSSSSLATVFVDSSSQLQFQRNFGNTTTTTNNYCTSTNGSSGGILREWTGHDCLRNDCQGECITWDESSCPGTVLSSVASTPLNMDNENSLTSSSSSKYNNKANKTILLFLWMVGALVSFMGAAAAVL